MTLNLADKTPKERERLIENKARREISETWLATVCFLGYIFWVLVVAPFLFVLIASIFFDFGLGAIGILVFLGGMAIAIFGPAIWYQRLIRSASIREFARHGRPFCLRCYYDLVGLETSERCPECGASTVMISSAE